tara:strand:- start:36 stop:239 length:204 start_codon:yes stop_codon:yes gene_type:complete
MSTLDKSISKAEKLKAQIANAKAELKKLEEVKKIELGNLLIKYNLDTLGQSVLERELSKIAKEHVNA